MYMFSIAPNVDPRGQGILWRRAPPSKTNCADSGREADFCLADIQIESASVDFLASCRRSGVSKRAFGDLL